VVGHNQRIRIRRDSKWNVPEPELTLVINRHCEIVGFCAGNDVSSRDIEGENPLYLPQAKIYDGACALGPGIQLAAAQELQDLPIELTISHQEKGLFHGETSTGRMNRRLEELTEYLCRELTFPQGVFLMTGTGIVPPDGFTLSAGHRVQLTVGDLRLENEVTDTEYMGHV
jgi:2-dehydro-3-deoxy-D-arabinonate dehydratase